MSKIENVKSIFFDENTLGYILSNEIIFGKCNIKVSSAEFISGLRRYSEYLILNTIENNIYFFSLWEGYFQSFILELIDNQKEYEDLPNFIKNWNECKGWCGIDPKEDIILENELDWLLSNIPIINENHQKDPENCVWDNNCINDLLIFLNFVKTKAWELRVSEE